MKKNDYEMLLEPVSVFSGPLHTYSDMRLKGLAWFKGLLIFMAACSVGALANVGIAAYLFENRTQWMLAAIAGVLVGAFWNYAITQLYTWGKNR